MIETIVEDDGSVRYPSVEKAIGRDSTVVMYETNFDEIVAEAHFEHPEGGGEVVAVYHTDVNEVSFGSHLISNRRISTTLDHDIVKDVLPHLIELLKEHPKCRMHFVTQEVLIKPFQF